VNIIVYYFYHLGDMVALHSAEFDDMCVNSADEDDKMANEGQRYDFITNTFI